MIDKSLNPEWNETFDLPINGYHCLLLEIVCWDKDRFGRDYLGELNIPLEEIFTNGQAVQEVIYLSFRLQSTPELTFPHSRNGTSSNPVEVARNQAM